MKITYQTKEECTAETLRIGAIIKERNQAYLDNLGKGQKDNTIKWAEEEELNGRWALVVHPNIEHEGDYEIVNNYNYEG